MINVITSLSFHELIPEQVFGVTSVTIKAARNYKTSLGVFSYTRLSMPFFP
ncbi:hypothetical protein [Lunatibacter salilacus]|uniref:hypothetical protein n=1 Tax=Lunatibacter salilacus TaxID=2483804 RepID=UPI00131DA674|nr:hypothetical protein [Lunatibacter salilacus]